MEVTSNIFKKVSDYLEHHITLEQLEEWLAPNLGVFLSLPPNDASELAATIELGLAEMTKGHRTEEEFQTLVKEFIRSRDFIFVVSVLSQPNHTSSEHKTYQHEWASMAPPQEQHLGWKYVDITLGTAS